MPPQNEYKLVPSGSEPPPKPVIEPRTPEQQSWGTIFALIIIVAMIVVGALYAWGKRIAEERALTAPQTSTETF